MLGPELGPAEMRRRVERLHLDEVEGIRLAVPVGHLKRMLLEPDRVTDVRRVQDESDLLAQLAPQRVGRRLSQLNPAAGTGPQSGGQPGILKVKVHQQNSPIGIHDKSTNRGPKTKITGHGEGA
jgi:hypothetical protein